MPPTELIKVSEDGIVAQALKPSGMKRSLAEMVPDDLDPREALKNIKELAKGFRRESGIISTAGAILGAYMELMVKRPEIYEAAGYLTLSAFEEAEVLPYVAHGTCWNYKRFARVFPEVTIKQILDIGSDKMNKAARVCELIDANEKQRSECLTAAIAAKSTKEFVAGWVKDHTGLASEDITTESFTIIGSGTVIGEIREWLADPGFIQWAGTDASAGMVLAAIQTATAEFTSPAPTAEEPAEIQTGAPVVDAGEWA